MNVFEDVLHAIRRKRNVEDWDNHSLRKLVAFVEAKFHESQLLPLQVFLIDLLIISVTSNFLETDRPLLLDLVSKQLENAVLHEDFPTDELVCLGEVLDALNTLIGTAGKKGKDPIFPITLSFPLAAANVSSSSSLDLVVENSTSILHIVETYLMLIVDVGIVTKKMSSSTGSIVLESFAINWLVGLSATSVARTLGTTAFKKLANALLDDIFLSSSEFSGFANVACEWCFDHIRSGKATFDDCWPILSRLFDRLQTPSHFSNSATCPSALFDTNILVTLVNSIVNHERVNRRLYLDSMVHFSIDPMLDSVSAAMLTLLHALLAVIEQAVGSGKLSIDFMTLERFLHWSLDLESFATTMRITVKLIASNSPLTQQFRNLVPYFQNRPSASQAVLRFADNSDSQNADVLNHAEPRGSTPSSSQRHTAATDTFLPDLVGAVSRTGLFADREPKQIYLDCLFCAITAQCRSGDEDFPTLGRSVATRLQRTLAGHPQESHLGYCYWVTILANQCASERDHFIWTNIAWRDMVRNAFTTVKDHVNVLLDKRNTSSLVELLLNGWLATLSYQHIYGNSTWIQDIYGEVIVVQQTPCLSSRIVCDFLSAQSLSVLEPNLDALQRTQSAIEYCADLITSARLDELDILHILRVIRLFLESLLLEIDHVMEHAILKSFPQLMPVIKGFSDQEGHRGSRIVKLLVLCEVFRDDVRPDIKLQWLQPYLSTINQLSLLLRTAVETSSGVTGVSKENRLNTIILASFPAFLLLVVMGQLNQSYVSNIASLKGHLQHIQTLIAATTDEDFTTRHVASSFLWVAVIAYSVPYVTQKGRKKLNVSDFLNFQANLHQLPRLLDEHKKIRPCCVEAYTKACITLADVFPEASLMLLSALIRGWVATIHDEESATHYVENFSVIADVYRQQRNMCSQFKEEIMDLILTPFIDEVTDEISHLHTKAWIAIQNIFRVEGGPFYLVYGGYFCSKLCFFPDYRLQHVMLLMRHNIIRMSIQSSLLLDYPDIVYCLLMADEVGGLSIRRILDNGLASAINNFAVTLKVTSGLDLQQETLGARVFDYNTSLLVWTLGAKDPIRSRALQALKVLCALRKLQAWRIPDKMRNVTEYADHAFVEIISKQFLLIVSTVLQHDWINQTLSHQEHGLRCLYVLLEYLAIEDLIKHLAKIVIILDAAIASNSSQVRCEAVRLSALLCTRLPVEILRQNIATLVMSLYPIAEGRVPRPSMPSTSSSGERISNTEDLSSYAVFVSLESDCFGAGILQVLKQHQFAALEAESVQHATELALDLICHIFGDNGEQFPEELKMMPCIPDFPRLQNLRQAHAREVQAMNFHQRCTHLCNLLRHDNPNVRLIALQQLNSVMREKKADIYRILSISRLNTSRFASENVVAMVMKYLLGLVATEQISWVKDECARCLGELGSIDPSYIRIRIGHSQKGSSSGDDYLVVKEIFPWAVNRKDFTYHVLANFLVPGLKSAQGSAAQDRCCFAIQEVLKLLTQQASSSSTTGSGTHTSNSRGGGSLVDVTSTLQRLNILEIVEPFLTSKYLLEKVPKAKPPPIYRSGMHCKRWLFLWCRYLITLCKGPFAVIYDACKGVLRYRTDLCQFLLPFLLLDVLLQRNAEETALIVKEMMLVLGDASNKGDNTEADPSGQQPQIQSPSGSSFLSERADSCVQSIFTLLDKFDLWETQHKKSVATAQEDVTLRNPSNANHNGFGSLSAVAESVRNITAALPLTVLSNAALSIKAYARALKYLELNARQRAFVESQSLTTATNKTAVGLLPIRNKGYDGANLPTLLADDIDSLAGIYSLLEDSDSLQGIQVLRRKWGYPETIIHRVLELELNDDWLGALLEYELLQNSALYQASLSKLRTLAPQQQHALVRSSGDIRRSILPGGSSGKKAILRMDSIAIMNAARRRHASSSSSALTSKARPSESNTVHHIPPAMEELNMDFDDISEIERGKLRCLIELGHLESAIYHAEGKSGLTESLQRVVLGLGTEAAWRLNKWDSLDEFLGNAETGAVMKASGELNTLSLFSEADNYQMRLGKALSCLRQRDTSQLQAEIRQARLQTMSALSAASMESYGRSYPMLVRLQTLAEMEIGRELLSISQQHAADSDEAAQKCEDFLRKRHWNDRVEFMPESMIQKSHLMAVRRAILGLCGLNKEISHNWLEMSKLYSQMGRFDSARNALKNAEQFGLDPDIFLLEECNILREQGQLQRALILLEPNPVDITMILQHLKIKKKADIPVYMDSEEKRVRLARRLHQATQFMVEAKQSQGHAILERYRAIVALNKSSGAVFFDYGKYYEFLYHEHVAKELANEANAASEAAAMSSSTRMPTNASSAEIKLSYHYLEKTIEKYGNCLMVADEALSTQVLPRLLTLWLSFTSLIDTEATLARASSAPSANRKNGASTNSVSALTTVQMRVNDRMQMFLQQIHPRVWFHGIQQIVSRVLHRNAATVEILVLMIIKVMVAFPKQGVWHLSNLVHSLNTDRKQISKRIIQETHRQIQSSLPEDAQMLVDCVKLFQSLVQLAEHQTKEKKLRWHVESKLRLSAFLVPSQTVLMQCASTTNNDQANFYNGDMMFIHKFNESVDVASSKAKPKTITLETTCGCTIKFLCKQEKDGDLRKDARMMEFNSTVNRLLQSDPQGRKRKLRLRTYAVVCLNEECGILEWVDNTACLRHVVNDAHTVSPDQYPNISYRDVYHNYVEMQTKFDDDMESLVSAYEALIVSTGYRACFHQWFLEKFADPTEWLEARTTYTRSVAVWSGVGHVIGLGDRHTENVLIDTMSGECVHVDFDCLFDKGLTLQKPEIIPFRLTPNIVDAMGVSGVEGCYRRSLEVCLEVLRANKETLLSVLEPFLRDPTVAWGRSGRAQRSDSSVNSRASTTFHDHENKEAKDMLSKVADRLQGIFNIVHPHREKFLRGASKRNQALPTRGIGAGKEDFLPLSVSGQTQKLIDEATAVENLAQLYIGWQPWV